MVIYQPDDEVFASFSRDQLPFNQPISKEAAWDLAYACALQGAGNVESNPLVGAVAVDSDGRLLDVGWHAGFGKAHAEAHLVANLVERGEDGRLRGATVYVTLEPCSHFGRNPPCADLLIKVGVAKVLFHTLDPNPLVAGQGVQRIRNAGISCHRDSDAERVHWLNARYLKGVQSDEPFVGLKMASTLNGVTASAGDQRSWITSDRARRYGRWLRVIYDAVAVGANTVLADDPELLPRDAISGDRSLSPRTRVVFDGGGAALRHAAERSFKVCEAGSRTIWVARPDTWSKHRPAKKNFEQKGIEVLEAVTVRDALLGLRVSGVTSLLVEGGARTVARFLTDAKPNWLHSFVAPKVHLGPELIWWGASKEVTKIDLPNPHICLLGKDLVVEGAIGEPS